MQFFLPLEGYVIKIFYKGVGVKGQWTWIKMQLSINDNNFSQECPVVILFGRKGVNLEANIFMYSLGLKVKGQWTLANIFGELEWSAILLAIFSSPKPKAQGELLPSILLCRASSLKCLQFHLLENVRSDSNETWQESSLEEGDSKLFKWYSVSDLKPHRARILVLSLLGRWGNESMLKSDEVKLNTPC